MMTPSTTGEIKKMKNFLIGLLALVAIPIWLPLMFIFSLYRLIGGVGGEIVEFLKEMK